MPVHFCPSNPCPLCNRMSFSRSRSTGLIETGYVFAPYIPMVVTPSILEEQEPGRALMYPVAVLGCDGVDVGDLVRIVMRNKQLERFHNVTCGIYLGSEEFTPASPTSNDEVHIRHVFNIDNRIIRVKEDSAWIAEVVSRRTEASCV